MSGFAYLTQMCLLITIGMMTHSLCTIVWRPVSLRNKDRRIFITRSTNKFSILLFLNIASWNSSCEQVRMSKWACQMLQIRKPQVEVQKLPKVIRTTVWVSLPHSSKILDLSINVQRLKRSAHKTTHITPYLFYLCSAANPTTSAYVLNIHEELRVWINMQLDIMSIQHTFANFAKGSIS